MRAFDEFEVVVPASTANLGPGFDSLGMALNLFAPPLSPQERKDAVLRGSRKGIPADDRNLVIQAMREVFYKEGNALRLEM